MIKHPFRTVAVAAAALLGAGAMTAPAMASNSAATPASASGDATVAIGHMVFDAHNTGTGTDAATGTFSVAGDLMPISVPGVDQLAAYSVGGPVSCLHVQGNQAGLVFTMTSATGPAIKYMKDYAMYITIKQGSGATPSAMGFSGPIPAGLVHNCPALLAFMNVQSGSVSVNS